MWRASSTCWVERKVASSSDPWAATRPVNLVVMRSSATIREDSAKWMIRFTAGSIAGHCSRSADRSISNGLHWDSSQWR